MIYSIHKGFAPHDGSKFIVDQARSQRPIGKKVVTRPIHVSSSSWVLRADWLAVGWEVLSGVLSSDCDFLLPTPVAHSQKVKESELSHASAQRASQGLFSLLQDPFKRFLFDGNNWREHSGRTFLPSAASVLDMECKIQRMIWDGISAGTRDFTHEKDSLISLGRWMRSKGIPPETVDKLTFPASSSSAPVPPVQSALRDAVETEPSRAERRESFRKELAGRGGFPHRSQEVGIVAQYFQCRSCTSWARFRVPGKTTMAYSSPMLALSALGAKCAPRRLVIRSDAYARVRQPPC